jgi:glycerol-3-phosphate O-acyltransferase
MEDEPQISLRQLSQQTELSLSTCQRIVRKDLDNSVTAERYRNNILDVFINQLQLVQGYFQQDGTTAEKTLRYLSQFFDDRLINRDVWPALTPLDYYLFPHSKQLMI